MIRHLPMKYGKSHETWQRGPEWGLYAAKAGVVVEATARVVRVSTMNLRMGFSFVRGGRLKLGLRGFAPASHVLSLIGGFVELGLGEVRAFDNARNFQRIA